MQTSKFKEAQLGLLPEKKHRHFKEIKAEDMRGDRALLERKLVSIVGGRKASPESLDLTKKWTEFLVRKDFVIVSGLARGIDTKAHKTALKEQGKTIAVIGTPFSKVYPPENKGLADEISRKGLLVTTAKAHETFGKYLFPRRNKYMAQISHITLVIDAGEKSGVRYQCAECLKAGKTLIFSQKQVDKNYKWVEDFIKDGAQVINSEKEFDEILYKL